MVSTRPLTKRRPIRGAVHWVRIGAEPRPALVMTRDAAIAVVSRLIVVPATRTIRGIPTEVELDHSDGMPEHCALSFDNTTLVGKQLIGERITTLGEVRMAQVCRAWRLVADC